MVVFVSTTNQGPVRLCSPIIAITLLDLLKKNQISFPDYANDINEDVHRVVNAEDLGKFARPFPTDESLENPLLGLTSQEYLAFK